MSLRRAKPKPLTRQPRSAVQLLIEKKAKGLVTAEKLHWQTISSLRKRRHELADALALPIESPLPESISSTVWGFKDGVAFVRHKTVGEKPRVDFRALPITLDEWGRTGLIVPLEGGDFSLAQAHVVGGTGNFSMVNCQINDITIPYVEFAHLRYGDPTNTPSVERAILDFQWALLGLHTQQAAEQPKSFTSLDTIGSLKRIAIEFESLLNEGIKEEAMQVFLKENSFVLHPSADCIPKKKLGEDFVTDFVLVATTTQGPTYVLVEIERASHPVLTKDLSLSAPVSHALKQIRDWDVWLEKNKAYVQNKLPGFETPNPA